MSSTSTYTGGCQCGAVRFAVTSLGRASICHCRMCQKAFGNVGAPLVTARDLVWTRGEPKRFRSSNKVQRGFCAECGTPLTYEYEHGLEVSICAFDRPAQIAPVIQLGTSDKLPWFDGLASLPTRTAQEWAEVAGFFGGIVSRQHPDHDTPRWPPAQGDSP